VTTTDAQSLPEFGPAWEELRRRRGISRAALARRTDLSIATLWRLEHDGPASPAVRRLVAVALGVPTFLLPKEEGHVSTETRGSDAA
jgi:transcriptional regulator with XRE-family HTH domain